MKYEYIEKMFFPKKPDSLINYLNDLGEVEWMKRMPRLYWEIADSEATQLYKAEHISHMSYGHLIIIDNPTIAEQLTMDIMGIMFVFEHRQHRFAMRNKRFKKKYFNA